MDRRARIDVDGQNKAFQPVKPQEETELLLSTSHADDDVGEESKRSHRQWMKRKLKPKYETGRTDGRRNVT